MKKPVIMQEFRRNAWMRVTDKFENIFFGKFLEIVRMCSYWQRFSKEYNKSKTYVNENKIGRNDNCPCGSGKKYKKCCAKADKQPI